MTNEALNIEKQFISLLLKYKDLVEDYIESSIEVEYFDHGFAMILHAIKESFTNDVLLTRKSFLAFLDKFISSRIEQSQLELNFGQISFTKADRHDYPMLKEKIINDYLVRSVSSGITNFNKDRANKGEKFAVKQLAAVMSDLVSSSRDGDKIIYQDINTITEEYANYIDDIRDGKIKNKEFISFGIEELDKTSGIGLSPGTLTLFCGDVGGYKSTMMLNVGANVWWNQKYNVLHIPLEMPRELMLTKLISRQTQTPFDLLQNPGDMTSKQWTIARKIFMEDWRKHEAKFYIMESYQERTKVSVIRRMIERHLEFFKPRLVIVDYIANLQPDKANHNRNDLEIGEMLKDLRYMGKPKVVHNEGFAIISGAQLGREALKRVRRQGGDKASFYSEDIRGSHEYSADADTMYAMYVDEAQPEGKLTIYCVKSRYGKKTFENGSNKAILEVKPELTLIRSASSVYSGEDRDEVLQKAIDEESQDLDFESITESDDIDVDATFNKGAVSKKLDGEDPELW